MPSPLSSIETAAASARVIGRVRGGDDVGLDDVLGDPRRSIAVARGDDGNVVGVRSGTAELGADPTGSDRALVAWLPARPIEALGDASFREDHGVTANYVAGAMANGIASVELVEAMAGRGLLGFFGAAGLAPNAVRDAVERLRASLGDRPYGVNLIHSPNEPQIEREVCEILLANEVRCVEASAYLDLTLPVVRYRLDGIHRDADGRVVCPNRVVAKASRLEVARKFFAPAPEPMLRELVESGVLTADQAELAKQVPVAEDLTAEADSGGHTDRRPALALVPSMIQLRDRVARDFPDFVTLRVGAAGGIATPESTAAAFSLGAAYVVVGSVHQACVESGSSERVRALLAEAGPADVIMAPAADMFEMGVDVQVLKRGTMFAQRGKKMRDLYRAHASWSDIPERDRALVEKQMFRKPFDDVWSDCVRFFQERDPSELARAETDPKHQMALAFRWYLGQSSLWANRGVEDRAVDYQVWCGPAMGAFNEWARDSHLEKPENRRVTDIGRQLLSGATRVLRRFDLESQGVPVPAALRAVRPLEPTELDALASLGDDPQLSSEDRPSRL